MQKEPKDLKELIAAAQLDSLIDAARRRKEDMKTMEEEILIRNNNVEEEVEDGDSKEQGRHTAVSIRATAIMVNNVITVIK